MEIVILEKRLSGKTTWKNIEFEGAETEFIQKATNHAVFFGDSEGKSENYKRIDLNRDDVVIELKYIPAHQLKEIDVISAIKQHNENVTNLQLKQVEQSERAELARLLQKYGNPKG